MMRKSPIGLTVGCFKKCEIGRKTAYYNHTVLMSLFFSKMVVIVRNVPKFTDCLQVNETGRCNTTSDATYEEMKCLDRTAICRYINWKKC